MNSAGLLIMALSVGTVTYMFCWCIWKVLTTPGEAEKIHMVEFDTPDIGDDVP